MAQSLPTTSNLSPNANEALVSLITAALRDAELISAGDEEAVKRLLTTGNTKAGEWRLLLEKNLLTSSTTIDTDHAATHLSA